MTKVVSLTGDDTTTIEYNGTSRVLNDFGNGDVVSLTFPNEEVNHQNGKNGNVVIVYNYTGLTVEVEIRVMVGSSDDKFLNSIIKAMRQDPPSFSLITGSFVKRTGDGAGNVTNVEYSMDGGYIRQGVDAKENVEGDVENGIAVYRMRFTNNSRDLG